MASTSLPTPSSTSSSGAGESNSRRYCFDVAQFAAEGFDPAAFVTAAKEGASLEASRQKAVDGWMDGRRAINRSTI